jgi:hypothetical protein
MSSGHCGQGEHSQRLVRRSASAVLPMTHHTRPTIMVAERIAQWLSAL